MCSGGGCWVLEHLLVSISVGSDFMWWCRSRKYCFWQTACPSPPLVSVLLPKQAISIYFNSCCVTLLIESRYCKLGCIHAPKWTIPILLFYNLDSNHYYEDKFKVFLLVVALLPWLILFLVSWFCAKKIALLISLPFLGSFMCCWQV